jgi:hypothetical protein
MYPILAFFISCFLLCFCLVLFLHAVYGSYRYEFRTILSSILSVLEIFYTRNIQDNLIDRNKSSFDPSYTDTVWQLLVAFVFFFVVCVVIVFPAYVLAVLLDSMRRLRLLHDSMALKLRALKEGTWSEFKDSIALLLLVGILTWLCGVVDILAFLCCCKKDNKKNVSNRYKDSSEKLII